MLSSVLLSRFPFCCGIMPFSLAEWITGNSYSRSKKVQTVRTHELLCHLFFLRNDQDSNVQYFWFTLPTTISIFEFLYVFLILYLRKHGNGKFLRGFPGSPCLMTGYPKLAASKQTIIKIWVCTSVCVYIYIHIQIWYTDIHIHIHISYTYTYVATCIIYPLRVGLPRFMVFVSLLSCAESET